ncbi:hypothetical protein BM1_03448 [Bipolaris maydis]|nr:hypothetical protein BM1_03448 [Bipolaris maydis]
MTLMTAASRHRQRLWELVTAPPLPLYAEWLVDHHECCCQPWAAGPWDGRYEDSAANILVPSGRAADDEAGHSE